MAAKAKTAAPKAASASLAATSHAELPPLPGEPPDVAIATTGAANTMGIPPAVAMSVIAAAKTGDKGAQKEIAAARAVYQAAKRGDPIAQKQLASVKDNAQGDADAARKAAYLAAAIGLEKGWTLFRRRKKAVLIYEARELNARAAAMQKGFSGFFNGWLKFGPGIYAPFANAIYKPRVV